MNNLHSIRILMLNTSILCLLGACAAVSQGPANQRGDVLFIGDSFTYYQSGLDFHFERAAASATPPLVIKANSSTQGGAPLKTLWDIPGPRAAIENGGYKIVVLQEDLSETTVANFRDYARRFVGEIRKAGARPILLMAWAYKRLGWISMEQIAQAHRDAAKELDADVAPVGLAWQKVMMERPAMDMYASYREHPSIYGTYLATLVVYATVYQQNPTGLSYRPQGIGADDAAFLCGIAWQTVQEYRVPRSGAP
ncbi:MAG TPA: hypothetical protein VK210_01800 [Terriglobia bacterium]|nr:hypothetical protein [Terriglobia bacterium]